MQDGQPERAERESGSGIAINMNISNETDEPITIEPGETLRVKAKREKRRLMSSRRKVIKIQENREE